MSRRVEHAAEWMYRGVWAVLVEWLRVPDTPPTLPVRPGGSLESFRPAEGFLRYLKFWFWLALLAIDLGILMAWIAVTIAVPWLGALLALPALVVAVLPDVVAYVAIHVRYDTTWYVMTDRSLRIRRGVWIIHETTITFENVQNVRVEQGPVQRHFGIANVVVETAGAPKLSQHGQSGAGANQGVIEGVVDAAGIRDRILARLRQSRSAGLGDEESPGDQDPSSSMMWTPSHLAALREIRNAAASCRAAVEEKQPEPGV